MAQIIKHPAVEDYFVELTLGEIKARPQGIIDLYEANRLVILKDYRMPVDLSVFQMLSGNLSKIVDPKLRKAIKKLESPKFFQGSSVEPTTSAPSSTGTMLPRWLLPRDKAEAPSTEAQPSDSVQRAIYDVLCNGDATLYRAAREAMRKAHESAMELFGICFPGYDYFKVIPSVRLTTTLFENLHWDNHQIAEDFQQVRIFCNLDQRPRIWHTSHNFITYAESLYKQHELGRFKGKDPNELNDYICGKVLGGTQNACKDSLPRHVIAFEPGEVWFGESRMLSHQIYYGERAMVYMYFVSPQTMHSPDRRFNRQVEHLHERMA
jgi:hypothetical protein